MSRRITLSMIALIIVLVFSAGCIESMKETDPFAAKLDAGGTLTWIRIINTGQNELPEDFQEIPGGGYVITGGMYRPLCNYYSPETLLPVRIQISSQGRIDLISNGSELYRITDIYARPNRTGLFSLTLGDGGRLSTYPQAKGNTVYYRVERTGTGGERLWDTAFLTLKSYPGGSGSFRDSIVIKGIAPTADKGYIIWGYLERNHPC